MAKLSDVAEKAGVSVTTASLVLSGKGRISNEVRQKVINTANELEYKRIKQTGNSHWVLLLNIDQENDNLSYFFNPIIRQLSSSAKGKGFSLIILPFRGGEPDDELYNKILDMRISAVFSIHFISVSLFKKLEAINIPCVVINNSSHQEEFFTVCVDDFQGAYEGTMKLVKAGHRHIACIDYHRNKMPGIMADRYFGFRKALDESGLSFSDENRLTVDINDRRNMENRVSELILNSPQPFTALFLHDDMIATRIIHILEKLKINVPEDISIIAPGDTLNYELPETPLISTMRIDNALMGNYAAEMMLERLQKGEQTPHVLKIKQVFIDRKSIKSLL